MTRIAAVDGRLKIVVAGGTVDVHTASAGVFSTEPQAIYDRWEEFLAWAQGATLVADGPVPDPAQVSSPVPAPRQAIAVGLNYRSYLDYAQLSIPTEPGVFAKFFTALTGPYDDITLPSDQVTGEVELVLVVAKRAWKVTPEEALDHLAGVTVGQDLTDGASYVRIARLDGGPGASYVNPAKSRPGFAPVGPEVVSLDEAGDLDNLAIQLRINGVLVQDGNTDDAVFGIRELVSRISDKVPLLPGDIIFTGSPGRVDGASKSPFAPGDVLEASVGNLGVQRHVTVAQG